MTLVNEIESGHGFTALFFNKRPQISRHDNAGITLNNLYLPLFSLGLLEKILG